jgi:ParB-like chromosome segregation protein Spo0J
MAVKKDPRTLELAEPFRSLFPVDAATLKLVTDSIRENGFQLDKPILVWKDAFGERGRQVVVDGHTRHRAALDLKLPEMWATLRQFKGVDAAITAAIGEQVQRRNLNREQIAAYVVSILPLLDDHVPYGLGTRTARQLAEMLGVSKPTIDRARGVLGSGRTDLIDAVKNGEMSLLVAYTETTGGSPPAQTPTLRGPSSAAARLAQRAEEARADLAIGLPGPVMSDQDLEDFETVLKAAPTTPAPARPAAEDRATAEPDQPDLVDLLNFIVFVDGEIEGYDPADREHRLQWLHYLLRWIEPMQSELLRSAIGITVKAAGIPGTLKIAELRYDKTGAIHVSNQTGSKTIAMTDISGVVRIPEGQ